MIGHPAEIIGRRLTPCAGEGKTVDLPGTVGDHVHHDRQFGKIKGGVLGVQRLDQTGSQVQLVAQPLPALHGAILSPDLLDRFSTGKTEILSFFFYEDKIIHAAIFASDISP